MKSIKTLTLLSLALLSATLMAEPNNAEDITILEDMTLYSSVNKNNLKYKEIIEQNYDSQRYSNIFKLQEELKKNPKMSDVILPLISYLDKNENIEDAKAGLGSLLIELSTETK